MWQYIQTIIDQPLHQNIENQYQKRNKKLDALTSHNPKHHKTQITIHFQPRIMNLSKTYFTKEQISILSLGPNCAIAKEPKKIYQ
jgi:hypothetical protein